MTQLTVGFAILQQHLKINYEYEHPKRVINRGLQEEWKVEDLQRETKEAFNGDDE
jgi:hypothetical protein